MIYDPSWTWPWPHTAWCLIWHRLQYLVNCKRDGCLDSRQKRNSDRGEGRNLWPMDQAHMWRQVKVLGVFDRRRDNHVKFMQIACLACIACVYELLVKISDMLICYKLRLCLNRQISQCIDTTATEITTSVFIVKKSILLSLFVFIYVCLFVQLRKLTRPILPRCYEHWRHLIANQDSCIMSFKVSCAQYILSQFISFHMVNINCNCNRNMWVIVSNLHWAITIHPWHPCSVPLAPLQCTARTLAPHHPHLTFVLDIRVDVKHLS